MLLKVTKELNSHEFEIIVDGKRSKVSKYILVKANENGQMPDWQKKCRYLVEF